MKYSVKFETPSVGETRQELSNVLAYWSEVKNTDVMPSWRYDSFSLSEIDPKSVPYVAVFDVLESAFKFRFFGTGRVLLNGRDFTNRLLCEYQPKAIALKIEEELKRVIECKKPMLVTTKGWLDHSSVPVKYQFLYLPLSKDGGNVDTIFALGFDDESLRILHSEFELSMQLSRAETH